MPEFTEKEGEEREIFHLLVGSYSTEPGWSHKPHSGHLYGWQGLKHPVILHCFSGPDWKWRSQDLNQHSYGYPSGATIWLELQRGSLIQSRLRAMLELRLQMQLSMGTWIHFAEWTELPHRLLASIQVQVQVPMPLLVIQLPADAPGKAAEDSSLTGALTSHKGDSTEFLPWF